MKTTSLFKIAITASLLFFTATACTDSVSNVNEVDASEEDVTVLQNVVGDALSDQNEGFLSSINDLTARVLQDGIEYRFRENDEWRGPFNHFNHNYNPENGVHTIQYRRGFNRPLLSKLLQVKLEYIFFDANNGFIEFPGQEANQIETIAFNGTHEGFTEGPMRRSEFERTASWTLDGFGASHPSMGLSGLQSHNGSMTISNREGVQASRSYSMNFNLVDISIQKPNGSENRLEYLVTGIIEYDVELITMRNGQEHIQEFSGTIELNGDGSALMRVLGLQRVFRLQLATGRPIEG
jgi:hypothetical protein